MEMGLLPAMAGDIPLTSMTDKYPKGLVEAIRQFGKGALLIVGEPRIPKLTQRFLRVETRTKEKIAVTYVLSCNNSKNE